MEKLVGMAYCSRAVNFSFEEMEEILQVSRRNNAKAAMTGALIYDNTTYLQWLEGEEANLRDLFQRISQDSRHRDIRLLTVHRLEGRWFPDWDMAAAVTEGQTLRGLRLVRHITLCGFDPFGWSDTETTCFMMGLSDYMTRKAAPKSTPVNDQVELRNPGRDPAKSLDRHLRSAH